MNIPKLLDNVKVHPSVWRTIKGIEILDNKQAAKIVQRIAGLGINPMPDNGGCNSETVKNLNKVGVKVKRLKCLDILDYRIFYTHKKSGTICIYCVV